MTLIEALLVLHTRRGASSDAYSLLTRLVCEVIRKRSSLRDADLDDATSDTIFKIVRSMELGRFDPRIEQVARTYVFRAAYRTAISLARTRMRERNRHQGAPDVDDLAALFVDDDDDWDEDPELVRDRVHACVRVLLDQLAARAIERRRPANRDALRHSYEQIVAIRFGSQSVDQYVRHSIGADAGDQETLKRERDRLYKNHQRCRDALRDALSSLQAAGALTPAETAQAEACLGAL